MYIVLRMGNVVSDLLHHLPIKLDVSENLLCAEALVSTLIGIGLLAQGISGLKSYNHHSVSRAERHLLRAKRCLAFFALVYLIKIVVDVELTSSIGNAFEDELDKLAPIVGEHNRLKNTMHITILYENGTALFANRDTKCLPKIQHPPPHRPPGEYPPIPEEGSRTDPGSEPPRPETFPEDAPESGEARPNPRDRYSPVNNNRRRPGDDSTRRRMRAETEPTATTEGQNLSASSSRGSSTKDWRQTKGENVSWQRKQQVKKRHQPKLSFGDSIYFCMEEQTLVVQIDKIRGHVRSMLLAVLAVAAIINIVFLLSVCACIMCCNRRYKEACQSTSRAYYVVLGIEQIGNRPGASEGPQGALPVRQTSESSIVDSVSRQTTSIEMSPVNGRGQN